MGPRMPNIDSLTETANRTIEDAANGAKSVVSTAASKVVDVARDLPRKTYNAVRPVGTFARDNALVIGIAAGALAAIGVTIYLLRRD